MASKDQSGVTKTLRSFKRLLKESCTSHVGNKEDGFQTLPPLKGIVEVENNVFKDIEVSDGSHRDNSLKVKIVIAKCCPDIHFSSDKILHECGVQ
jgi:hypothetical protein